MIETGKKYFGFKEYCPANRRRFAILARVHAEYRKVAGMAGPFPVICIATEFADTFGWSAYQPDITVTLVNEDQELVALEQGAYLAAEALRGICIAGLNGFNSSLYFGLPFIATQTLCSIFHLFGHIFNFYQELNINSRPGISSCLLLA